MFDAFRNFMAGFVNGDAGSRVCQTTRRFVQADEFENNLSECPAGPLRIREKVSSTPIDDPPPLSVDRTPVEKAASKTFKSAAKLKVLASPFQEWADFNPAPLVLYKAMAELNVEIEGFSVSRLILGDWDIWHLHWPAELVLQEQNELVAGFWLAAFWIKLKIAKAKGVRIFWTVHNLRAHERGNPVLHKVFWRLFLPNVDGMILLSGSAGEIIRREYPFANACPTFVIPHGHYRGLYPDFIDRGAARERLGLTHSDFVILFFGQIRSYKGIPDLIRCFRAASVQGSCLVVAGRPVDGRVVERTIEAKGEAPNIELHLEFIGRTLVQDYLRAADLIVLPYTEILNSGTAILALSFDRPVLLPALGALPELCEMVGENWIRLYEGDLTPEVLRSAIRWAQRRQEDKCAQPSLDRLDWKHLAALTIEAFCNRNRCR
jgi:beta-1,4-mannosyltransferase